MNFVFFSVRYDQTDVDFDCTKYNTSIRMAAIQIHILEKKEYTDPSCFTVFETSQDGNIATEFLCRERFNLI